MPEVVFIPGFMQHADSWTPVAAAVGERYPVTLLEFRTWTFEQRVEEIRAAGEGRVVVGYSMGGRLALHAATQSGFAGVATVGASAGIEDPAQRARRRAADEQLAAWIETRPIEEVVERWERNPVFASQPAELVAAQRPGRLAHDPAELATLLRSAGQGALDPIWHELPAIEAPCAALAGALDKPYAAAAQRIAAVVPNGRAILIPDAGHAAHLEAPAAVADALLGFLAG